MAKQIYLGDSVYLDIDAEHGDVKIYLNNGEGEHSIIYLGSSEIRTMLRAFADTMPELYTRQVTKQMMIEYT